MASAEDTELRKLCWYQLGRGVSDRQWQEACGVLKVNRGGWDLTYMQKTAAGLGVRDLLEKALDEVG